ncbi:polygalacturonase QRT3 [Carica papaya]|uniref:polygalacturonase QRT3 n=1 Tax=Carica papaya TaxID=3649 RepID=UPI000B8CAEF7|nr:polygalacturonase QRT3 [Carica papaya]
MKVVVISLLIWVQAITCCTRNQMLQDFEAKLQHRLASLNPLPPPSINSPKMNGRVVYPIGYGADPTGSEDSSDAILEALSDAFELGNGMEMLPGVSDLGGVVIDFEGGNYQITKPITFPPLSAGNLLVKGGTLRASPTFPADRHLVELAPSGSLKSSSTYHPTTTFTDSKDHNAGIYYEGITFRDIFFDSTYRGGGLLVADSARIRIINCFFLHFTTQGILVVRGHETFISTTFLGQHETIGGDQAERDYSGTAIDLASNDNAITDVAIFSAAVGILLRGQANIVTGVHCYNKATYFGGTGILVKKSPGSSLTRIDNCYMDYTSIVMEDPVQVHVSNGLFLGDANVVLKSINGRISGVNIVDNMFTGSPTNMVPIVRVEGVFSSTDQVVIDRNNVAGMRLKSTVGKMTVAGKGRRWVADFSSVLVFPDRINHFQYSFYGNDQGVGGRSVVHAVTNVSNNVVVVESDELVSGVVCVFVDQYNMVGETNSVTKY